MPLLKILWHAARLHLQELPSLDHTWGHRSEGKGQISLKLNPCMNISVKVLQIAIPVLSAAESTVKPWSSSCSSSLRISFTRFILSILPAHSDMSLSWRERGNTTQNVFICVCQCYCVFSECDACARTHIGLWVVLSTGVSGWRCETAYDLSVRSLPVWRIRRVPRLHHWPSS